MHAAEEPKKKTDATTLPEVTVVAKRDASSPNQVNVTAAEIQKVGAIDLTGIFAETPEVRVGGGSPAGRKIYVRGFEERRFINALALIEEGDPPVQVAGMLGEFSQLDPGGFAQYAAAFPRIKDLPVFGQSTVDTVSVEKMIALQPDVAIFGLEGHGPATNDRFRSGRADRYRHHTGSAFPCSSHS